MSRRSAEGRGGRPLASLSLDLDNLWAYQMTHGDAGWEDHPTYLPEVVPTFLDLIADVGTHITVFVVGQDAALERNAKPLAMITDAGHEVGNHSFKHQPWLHRYTPDEIEAEIRAAEDAIADACGQRPVGFRGPGYSLSPTLLEVLGERGYEYDCSTLPTVIGPLARRFYFRSAKLDAAQREERQHLFGHWRDALQPLKPYWWEFASPAALTLGAEARGARLLEIPVSVLPGTRVPFHLSYVLYLAGRSEELALQYFANGLRLCRLAKVEPSVLLHPLDVVGADDVDALRFFPAMGLSGTVKRRVVTRCLQRLVAEFDVKTMRGHAAAISQRSDLLVRPVAEAGSAAEVAA